MKLTTITTLSMLTLAGLVAPATTLAAPAPVDTTANVTLEAGDTTIVNPPIDPIDPPTGQTGDLTIDAVSSFDFDTHKIEASKQTYSAVIPSGKVLGAQVTDKRATGAGWALQASATEFNDGTHTLKGAEFKLPAGTLKSSNANSTDAAPTTSALTLNTTAANVMVAQKDTGLGTWAEDFGSNVQLVVPAGNYAGAYTATVTWTLSDAPK